MIRHFTLIVGLAVVASSLKLDEGALRRDATVYCSDLKNVEGTHYTVTVEAGTPPQEFDLVIDTGSSNVIIESCECRASKFCEESNKCFESKQSSTLQIAEDNQGLETVVLMFGSGPIETVISTDVVRMGSVAVTLERGLFLMLDQMLDFSGPFEGIMGLGLPKEYRHRKRSSYSLHGKKGNLRRKRSNWMPVNNGFSSASWDDEEGEGRPYKNVHMQQNVSLNDTMNTSGRRILDAIHQKMTYESDFLRKAGVSRFSMCFSEDWDGVGGMLRLHTPPISETFSNIGSVHWALDFRGATVGNSKRSSRFCRLENMEQGQETPCGAILDSGTTYILGQEDHLVELYEDLCEQWPRCKKNHTAVQRAERRKSPPDAVSWSKYTAFEALMSDCDTWYDSPEGLNELPPIHFHIHNAGGYNKVLTLQPWSYVVARYEETTNLAQSEDDIVPTEAFVGVVNGSGTKNWMCEAAFGVMDYPTPRNGPAWVLGMPLFYSYVVQYDISHDPPTVSFSQDACRGCNREDHSNLTSRGVHPLHGPRNWRRRPRQVKGRPRMPDIDFHQPL